MEKSLETGIDRGEEFRIVGLVSRYLPIGWIPACAGMTNKVFGDDSVGFGLNRSDLLSQKVL